jgi:hypothetical protein
MGCVCYGRQVHDAFRPTKRRGDLGGGGDGGDSGDSGGMIGDRMMTQRGSTLLLTC